MIYKLKDGDVFKVLPILLKDNTFDSRITVLSAFLSNKIIYEYSGYLNGFIRSLNDIRSLRSIRHFYCIYINNKIEVIIVGNQLKKVIDSIETLDIRDNKHIQVSIEPIHVPNGDIYSNYDKSIVIDKNWEKPINDINNQVEWKNWIKKNQPGFIEDYIEERNIINNLNFLRNNFINNPFLSSIISSERNKKLNKILSKETTF